MAERAVKELESAETKQKAFSYTHHQESGEFQKIDLWCVYRVIESIQEKTGEPVPTRIVSAHIGYSKKHTLRILNYLWQTHGVIERVGYRGGWLVVKDWEVSA